MTTADPYSWGVNWPPSPIEREVRAERDTAQAKVRAVEELIVKHKTRPHDGRIPACQILAAWLLIDEARP